MSPAEPGPAEPARPPVGAGSAPLIRPATAADVPALLRLIRELAAYERAPDAVEAGLGELHEALFGTPPGAAALVAAAGPDVVGMALYFHTFSTWTGRRGVHLEDLYVTPAHRGQGTGRALMAALARHCVAHGLPRLEWSVLTWNTPALGFYASLGAAPQTDWATWRLSGPALRALGEPQPAGGHRPAGDRER